MTKPEGQTNCGSSHCSTAIFVKAMFTCRSHGQIPNAYMGRWVHWTQIPRVGDRVQLFDEFDELVSEICWHVNENAIEVVVELDCDSTADGIIKDGEVLDWDRVYGGWMDSARESGFNYEHGSHNSLTGLFGVPPRP